MPSETTSPAAVKPSSPRNRKPRVKPARAIRLCVPPVETCPGVVRITVGSSPTDYFLTLMVTDYGRGFALEKIGVVVPEVYHVNLDGQQQTCDCKGSERWGHCKHAEGMAALVAAGRL